MLKNQIHNFYRNKTFISSKCINIQYFKIELIKLNIRQRQGMVTITVEKAVLIQYQIAIALESGLDLVVDLVLDF